MGSARRVVITGMGVISPVGNTADEFWDSLVQGKSGIGPVTRFDASEFKSRIAGEVKDFHPETVIDPHEVRRLDYFSQYAICSADQAIRQSGLNMDNEDPFRVGVIFGSGIGGINMLEEQVGIYLSRGPGRVSPFYIPGMISDIASGHIAIMHGYRGPNYATTSACASGANAIGSAYHEIILGNADVMITGGCEGTISPTSMAGFINIKALSRRNDEPERASRPFDKERDGFVLGEGGAAVVIEELEHARARGAAIFAEITGVGFTGDAYHITAPHPEGIAAAKAMEIAVAKSGMRAEDIDYINTHGTSTPPGDIAETNAIKRAFGEQAYKMNISSTKSMTGHLLGAAGAVEIVATVYTIINGIIPPTINYENPDPECDLNYTPNTAVRREVNFAISNSFGFGGHNVTIAVKKFVV
jgi:3-oxoacyl-[acyl-carrier-protein] synthase II